MAKLVECRTCKKEVAKGAKVCPHCGEKNPTVKKTDLKTILVAVGIIVVLMAIFGPTAEEKEEAKKVELQKNKDRIVELVTKAKTVPAKNYTDNYNIYNELVELDPNNKAYEQKLAHYKAGKDLEAELALSCRVAGSKRNKKALNNSETYDEDWGFDEQWKNGVYYYEQEFTGKNAFGVASRFRAQYKCALKKDKSMTIERMFIREVK